MEFLMIHDRIFNNTQCKMHCN